MSDSILFFLLCVCQLCSSQCTSRCTPCLIQSSNLFSARVNRTAPGVPRVPGPGVRGHTEGVPQGVPRVSSSTVLHCMSELCSSKCTACLIQYCCFFLACVHCAAQGVPRVPGPGVRGHAEGAPVPPRLGRSAAAGQLAQERLPGGEPHRAELPRRRKSALMYHSKRGSFFM